MSELSRTSSDVAIEERDQLLKQFGVSGLRYDEFAREHNINPQTFKNWVWVSRRPKGYSKRYCPTERKKIVESFLTAQVPISDFAKTWGISKGTLSQWLQRYRERGADGLMNQRHSLKKDGRVGPKTPEVVRSEIIKIKKKEPKYGLKRIKQWMYRFRGVKISTGTVRKTVLSEGLPLAKVKKKTRRSSDKIRRFERARPMQLWQSDITQMTVGQHSMRVYLTIFMDDHSRYIVGWRLQSRQTSDLVMDAFKDAMVKYGKPEEVLTDQGRQYFAWRGKSDLEKLLEKENIKHVVSRAHHPQTLGKCERFWETVMNEFWTRVRPFDLDEARERLRYFIDHYNYQRPHQGIEGHVPADRFFGVAEDVRKTLERSVAENSLRIALGELPKPPAFLIGQVGDQRIAFHGTSGAFYLTSENINGEVNNGDTEEHHPAGVLSQGCGGKVDQIPSGDPGEATLGTGNGGRTRASTEESCHDDGVLAGKALEAGSSVRIGNGSDTDLAINSPGATGYECGSFSEPKTTAEDFYDREK